MATSALFLVLGACQPSQDLAAFSYGDYDPKHPPSIRNIGGDNLAAVDPSMFFWQGTYYVFSSGFSNSSSAGLDLRSSKDLQTFKLGDPLLSPNPAWVEHELAKVTVLWSPSVLVWDGMIHLYYAASWYGAARACIGHATSPSMQKPFVDDGQPIFCSNINDAVVDPFVAIDPDVILDDAGDPWMIFGSGLDGINIIALDRQGGRIAPKSSPQVVAAREPGSDQAIQAASLYHWRDYYYLFASHDWPPNHIIRVGRSKSVTGPYLDRDGNPMVTGGGTTVVDKDGFFHGPGSNMIFDDGKQRLNVYHAYNSTDDVVLRIAEMAFDKDGWPVSAGP